MPSTVARDLEGPQSGVHLGPGWYHNYHIDGLAFPLMVPDSDEGKEPAIFIRVEMNHGEPQLLGTLGLGCPVTSVPLYTKPDRYPRPAMTAVEVQVFREGEAYTPLVNATLDEEADVSLKAKVY